MTKISSSAFTAPICFARGRNGDVYGVTGQERGFRWDTVTAAVEQLGITAPAAPTVTAGAAGGKFYLSAIDVIDGGVGYETEPVVSIGGGGATLSFTATFSDGVFTATAHGMTNGTAVRLVTLAGGAGLSINTPYYVINATTDTFKLSLTSGGSAVAFTTNVSAGSLRKPVTTPGVAKANLLFGRVQSVEILRYGLSYDAPPAISCEGPTRTATKEVAAVLSVQVEPYLYQTESTYTDPDTLPLDADPPTANVVRYRVTGVTVTSGGSGYSGKPTITFNGNGSGAFAEAVLSSAGSIASVRVLAAGSYLAIPTASVTPDTSDRPKPATLSPVMVPALQGKFWCATRYVDDTDAAHAGPIPSSISELATVEIAANAQSISWAVPTSGIEARVNKIEFWRTTADQALVLYKVGEVTKSAAVAGAVANVYTYSDALSDAELADPSRTGFDALPITLPNGQPNARRFNPPPQNKKVIAVFQDRAWYAVDVPGRTWTGGSDATAAEPNSIYFSEVDEPESVSETNEIVIQENVKGQDRVTALMPFGGGMVVFQERHCYRLTFVSQPLIDSNVNLIGQRGCLNQRCWDTYDNVAYVVDSMGMYMLDGANAVPLSDPIETYWANNVIHFASSQWFFVRVDPVTRIVRFFHSVSAGQPDRALCFHPLTKAWWVETYAQTFAAMECLTTGGRQQLIAGGQTGSFYKFDVGNQDINSSGTAANIACAIRTGNMAFADEKGSRSIRVLYKPTSADCNLSLALHYNNSDTPRTAAVRTDRGTGFTTDGGANATLNLKLSRSALGDATGYAVCSYAGRLDDKSAGADRHLAVALSLTRPSGEASVLYGAAVEGVGQ